MKSILSASLVALVSAGRLSHHEGTFYEEYNVGGHSHPKSDGPHTEYTGPMPDKPSLPDIFDGHDDIPIYGKQSN